VPELPEVETVRRSLLPQVQGARVAALWTSGKPLRMRRPVDVRGLRAAAEGRVVLDARRVAKYLLLDFEAGGCVVVHLGMSGRLHVAAASEPRPPHTHVALALQAGRELRFVDPRRFGVVVPFASTADAAAWPALAELGVDPLSVDFTASLLLGLLGATRRPLKTFLLDQSAVVGLGNIYVAEALWEARLHPLARTHRLALDDARRLRTAIVRVLTRAIENRGTTLRDYVDASGEIGFNQLRLRAYGRTGLPCPRCKGSVINGVSTQGRGTFFCPKCQTRP
jgi:formamidopyrimidine-DNA glycosylase